MSEHRSPGQVLALLSLGCFVSTGPLYGQAHANADSLACDLRVYTKFLREEHVHPFDPKRRAVFDALEAEILRSVGDRSNEAFITDIMRLAAVVNDEHTMVWPERTAWLPYRMRSIDEGMVITATDGAHTMHALHRVLSINGMPINRVVDRYRPLVKDDNASYFTEFLHWHFADPAIMLGLGVIKGLTDIPFELLSPTGDTLRTTVNGVEGVEPAMVLAPGVGNMLAYTSTANYWAHFDTTDHSLYLQYRRCQEDKDRPFDAFTDSLFALIESERPERLIIDLRFNGGGASAVFAPFLRKLRKSYLNGEDRIRVLIGPGVFSSALMNAIDLKRNTTALFVGRMTGANVNHYGELRTTVLPYTKVRVTCSTKWWENWKGMVGGLRPEVEVVDTWADLIHGRDGVLEAAKKR